MVCCVRPERSCMWQTQGFFHYLQANKLENTGVHDNCWKAPALLLLDGNQKEQRILTTKKHKLFYWFCTNITWICLIWCRSKKIISFNKCVIFLHSVNCLITEAFIVFLDPPILSISWKILFDKEEELHIDDPVLISLAWFIGCEWDVIIWV